MTGSQAATNAASSRGKKVSIQERSVLVGERIVVNGSGANRNLLKQRFAEGAYQIQETPHFSVFTRSEPPTTILVHYFSPEEMNADIKHFLIQELKPLGLIKASQDFGMLFAGIIGSFFPDDIRSAWHGYGAKTLQRFLLFLSTSRTPTRPPLIFMPRLEHLRHNISAFVNSVLENPFSMLAASPASSRSSSLSAFRS